MSSHIRTSKRNYRGTVSERHVCTCVQKGEGKGSNFMQYLLNLNLPEMRSLRSPLAFLGRTPAGGTFYIFTAQYKNEITNVRFEQTSPSCS